MRFVWILALIAAAPLSAKYALVTGSSRGIGQALVEELIKYDGELTVFSVARGKQEWQSKRVISIEADLAQAEGIEKVQKVVRNVLGETGALDYLIHNAAVISPLGDIKYLSEQPIDELFASVDASFRTNVIAPYVLTLALLPELKKSKESRVLLVSSRAGDIPVPGAMTYSCTKAALDQLAMNFHAVLKNEIAIGLLHPGEVDTDMQGNLRQPSSDQMQMTKKFREAKASKKLMSATTSAQYIVYLLYHTGRDDFSKKKWNIYYDHPENFPVWLIEAIGVPPSYHYRIEEFSLERPKPLE